MKDNRKTEEMSVEDILKSIKGIINGHDVSEKAEEEGILELTNVANENDLVMEDDITVIEKDSLLSEQVANSVSKSFKHLTEKAEKAFNNKNLKDMSLEGAVIEILKPQLSEWLDENLPSLVNKLIEKEIKKLILDSKK